MTYLNVDHFNDKLPQKRLLGLDWDMEEDILYFRVPIYAKASYSKEHTVNSQLDIRPCWIWFAYHTTSKSAALNFMQVEVGLGRAYFNYIAKAMVEAITSIALFSNFQMLLSQ